MSRECGLSFTSSVAGTCISRIFYDCLGLLGYKHCQLEIHVDHGRNM